MSARPTGRRQALRGPLTDYLTDLQGSVRNLVGTYQNVLQSVASYFYCPTGNLAEAISGAYTFANPYRLFGMFYDWRFATYWWDGLQFDANSGNARQVGGFAEGIGTGIGITLEPPDIEDVIAALIAAIIGGAVVEQRASGTVNEPQYVVRGGACAVGSFIKGVDTCDPGTGILTGVSVQSFPGVPVEVLGSYVKNKQIGVTTVANIEAMGGTVTPDPLPNLPYHALLSGLTEEQMRALFVVQPNPFPGTALSP